MTADQGICSTCGQLVTLNNDGTARSHTGTLTFDVQTDGVCSGSHTYPEVDS